MATYMAMLGLAAHFFPQTPAPSLHPRMCWESPRERVWSGRTLCAPCRFISASVFALT